MSPLLSDRAPGNEIDVILTHPLHSWSIRTMVGLIEDLRSCEGFADLYAFQQQLARHLADIEERHYVVRRVAGKLRKAGAKLPGYAPELGTGRDPGDRESWVLEGEVYERVWRQLKTIGDALAWRAFGYDRRIIVALSRNQSPGPSYPKAGAAKERQFIAEQWRDHGLFALHHDLTSALTVGDVSLFHRDGGVMLYEIKSSEKNRDRKQDRRLVRTSEVLADGGQLPSGFTPVPTGVPFRTQLRALRQLLDKAHTRTGVQGGVVSPGRAAVAASQYTAGDHHDGQSFGSLFKKELDRCQRRIHARPDHALTFASTDLAARSPTQPPWAVYPVSPYVAASMTADAMFFYCTMAPAAIIGALSDVGVDAGWLQSLDGVLDWSRPLLGVASPPMIHAGQKMWVTTLNVQAFSSLMYEFVDLKTWARQVAFTLSGRTPEGVLPWPVFSDEYRTWHN